jgi:hypothetical protein
LSSQHKSSFSCVLNASDFMELLGDHMAMAMIWSEGGGKKDVGGNFGLRCNFSPSTGTVHCSQHHGINHFGPHTRGRGPTNELPNTFGSLEASNHPNFQTSKLPNFQSSKLPNFQSSQAYKLPNFQTSKLTNLQTSKVSNFQAFKLPKFGRWRHLKIGGRLLKLWKFGRLEVRKIGSLEF